MCGRLACILCPDELRHACAYPKQRKDGGAPYYIEPTYLESSYKYTPLYNLCPSSVVPILADKTHFSESSVAGCTDYVILPVRWGMLPTWANSISLKTHNARIESIMNSSYYKPELLKNHRCVVLCDGYFEWQSTRPDRQPYYVYPQKKGCDGTNSTSDDYWVDKPLLKLAGVFSQKMDEDGIMKYSCSIITKTADKSLSWLHNRMPIPLDTFEDVENWISNKKLDCNESFNFLVTYGEKNVKETKSNKCGITYYAVDKKFVNNTSCNTEKCIARATIKRQQTLDSWVTSKKSPAKSKEIRGSCVFS